MYTALNMCLGCPDISPNNTLITHFPVVFVEILVVVGAYSGC